MNELGQQGSLVYAPYRGCELEPRLLKPMFDLGRLGLLPFNLQDEDSIRASMADSDIVVNLIGKHYETKGAVPQKRADGSFSRINSSFEDVHVEGAATIARIAGEMGVESLVHVSALAANLDSKSRWNVTKAQGEEAVRAAFPDAIIVKPATVFGAEDRFLNWIAQTLTTYPAFPLLHGGEQLVQPVHCLDVGRALMKIVERHQEFKGDTFQLFGPADYTYKEVAEFVMDITMINRPMLDAPIQAAELAAKFLGEAPNPLLTPDMLEQLLEDVMPDTSGRWKTLGDLDIEATSMDKVAFDYLHRFREGSHFSQVEGYH